MLQWDVRQYFCAHILWLVVTLYYKAQIRSCSSENVNYVILIHQNEQTYILPLFLCLIRLLWWIHFCILCFIASIIKRRWEMDKDGEAAASTLRHTHLILFVFLLLMQKYNNMVACNKIQSCTIHEFQVLTGFLPFFFSFSFDFHNPTCNEVNLHI